MWIIDKEFSFDYGHRVWTQCLNTEFSIDNACVCRHLHGHRGKVRIYLESDDLDLQGMVTDFKHLGWLKQFLDSAIDHKFIIDRDDPLYQKIIGTATKMEPIIVPGTDHVAAYTPVMSSILAEPGSPEYEYYEGMISVDFVPTSENLSKWLFDLTQAKMKKIQVKVTQVDWWETPKSKSTYRPGSV